jgi:hypothetical protein
LRNFVTSRFRQTMFSWKFFGISLLTANDCFQLHGLLLGTVEFEG